MASSEELMAMAARGEKEGREARFRPRGCLYGRRSAGQSRHFAWEARTWPVGHRQRGAKVLPWPISGSDY